MKKASSILLLIGGILEITAAVGFMIAGVVMLLFGTPVMTNLLREIATEAAKDSTTSVSVDTLMQIFMYTFVSMGVTFLVTCVISVVGAILTFKASKRQTRGLFIAAMVFGILSGTVVATVGSIFGLISSTRE